IACKFKQAYGENDCVLVYQDIGGERFRMLAYTFWVGFDTGVDRYKLKNVKGPFALGAWDGENRMTTGMPIAVWYHNANGGRFWSATRSAAYDGQGMIISSSDDGRLWRREHVLERPYVAPVVTNGSPSEGSAMFDIANLIWVK
ncbi:MAG: hypothetical protein ABIK83_13045, partial [Candidatus Zixiibacteriota bacterium]